MFKRKYIYMLLPMIKEKPVAGMTQKAIEEELGLTGDRPIHNLLKRERKKEQQGIPKTRGRKGSPPPSLWSFPPITPPRPATS